MIACPCLFVAPEGVRLFSGAWYAGHRDHHLATFPHVDEVTRANLDDSVRRAEG